MEPQKSLPIITLFFIVAAFLPRTSEAEVWPTGNDNFFLSLKAEYYETDSYWDRDGEKNPLASPFRKLSIQPYLEYGLSDRGTLVAKFFYDRLDNGMQTNTGLADLELGYRRLIGQRDGTYLSLGAMALVPLGYSLEDTPQLGYSRFGLEGTTVLGRGWSTNGKNGYFESGIRYRHYFGYPPGQLRFFLVIGQDVANRLQLIFENELHWSLSESELYTVNDRASIDAYYRLFKTTLHARLRISETHSLVLSGFKHLWGKNTGAGGGVSLSLWMEF